MKMISPVISVLGRVTVASANTLVSTAKVVASATKNLAGTVATWSGEHFDNALLKLADNISSKPGVGTYITVKQEIEFLASAMPSNPEVNAQGDLFTEVSTHDNIVNGRLLEVLSEMETLGASLSITVLVAMIEAATPKEEDFDYRCELTHLILAGFATSHVHEVNAHGKSYVIREYRDINKQLKGKIHEAKAAKKARNA